MRSGDFPGAVGADLRAIETIGAALEGSGKPLVTTSGTLLLALAGIDGRPGTEQDVLEAGPRVDAENTTIALAERGVRSSVVRLPPLVHSTLDHHGFAPTLIAIARDKGVAGYVADGSNRWPAVHTLDAARAYRLALETAAAGSRLHAVADEHFSFLGAFVSLDNPTSSELTRRGLGWKPTQPGLVDDLEQGHYFKQ
jgi:nucleoside-diphosphate-sugar epimerase